MDEQKLKIKSDTIIRTVLLVIALINNALALFGKSPLPFSNEQVTQFVSILFTIAASMWSWWKNNNFSQAALKGQEVVDELKGKKKSEE